MKKNQAVINAALMLVIGILLIVFKGKVLEITMTILGACLIVLGVLDLVERRDYLLFAVKTVIGILIIVCGLSLSQIACYVIGALVLVYGMLQLWNFITSKTKISSFVDFLAVYSNPIMNILIGLCMLLVNIGTIANIVFTVLGIFFIIEALLDLTAIFKSKPQKAKVKDSKD